MRVLVVEDNIRLADVLRRSLAVAGFASAEAETAQDARDCIASERFDAVILDLGLPDEDGLALLREFRLRGVTAPVLVLTARDGLHDRVAGLDAGADDYLAKPFAMEELTARLRALLRRQGPMLGGTLILANLSLDVAARQAMVDGRPIAIPAREVDLLERLLRRPGMVVPRTMLEGDLVGASPEASSNQIEVYVHRLRRRLVEAGAQVAVHTLRGLGYMLAEQRTG